MRTWVTAPVSLPFWMMGEPERCVVKKGQQIFTIYRPLRHFFYKKISTSIAFFGIVVIQINEKIYILLNYVLCT